MNRGWLKRKEGVNNKGMGGRKGGKESTKGREGKINKGIQKRRGKETGGGGWEEGREEEKKRKSRGRRNLNV